MMSDQSVIEQLVVFAKMNSIEELNTTHTIDEYKVFVTVQKIIDEARPEQE